MATGSGQSKKKAKHAAAKSVLEKIKAAQKSTDPSSKGQKAIKSLLSPDGASGEKKSDSVKAILDLEKTDILSPYDDGIEGNPVGELQELCMNRRMQPPLYEVSHEEGQPHERRFYMECVVGKQKESGWGKSKKLAKRQAAHKMLKRLQEQPAENNIEVTFRQKMTLEDDDELAQGISIRDQDLKTREMMAKLHKPPKPGSKLFQIQECCEEKLSQESVRFLEQIASEEDLSVTFFPLEEKSKRGLCNCLVQLSTVPVAVCYGTGQSEAEAKKSAAFNALKYLQIMTK